MLGNGISEPSTVWLSSRCVFGIRSREGSAGYLGGMDVFFLLLGIDVPNPFVVFFGEVCFKAKQQWETFTSCGHSGRIFPDHSHLFNGGLERVHPSFWSDSTFEKQHMLSSVSKSACFLAWFFLKQNPHISVSFIHMESILFWEHIIVLFSIGPFQVNRRSTKIKPKKPPAQKNSFRHCVAWFKAVGPMGWPFFPWFWWGGRGRCSGWLSGIRFRFYQ